MKQFLYTLLSLGVGLLSIGSAAANDVPKVVIPDYVESVLKWFPADTETLIVASHCEDKIKAETTRFLRSLARQPIIKSFDDLMGQRHVLWAVHGGRQFDVISASGTAGRPKSHYWIQARTPCMWIACVAGN